MVRHSRPVHAVIGMVVLAGLLVIPVRAARADGPTEVPALTVSQWQADTGTGMVTYQVAATAAESCASACDLRIELGRGPSPADITAVTNLNRSLSASRGADGVWNAQAVADGDRVALPETTALRAVYSDAAGTRPGPWAMVGESYPDPVVGLTSSQWTRDTDTGQVSYDLVVDGVGLAKAGGPCEYGVGSSVCYLRVEAGRAGADGQVSAVVGSLPGCTGNGYSNSSGTAFPYGTWSASVHCAATNSTQPEITHIRAVLDHGSSPTITTPWRSVSAPYPDPTIDLMVKKWNFTGKESGSGAYFDIDLQSRAAGLAQAGGPCQNRYCTMVFEGGRGDDNNVIRTTSRLSTEGDGYFSNQWTAEIHSKYNNALIPDQMYMRTAIYSHGYLVLATAWQERSSIGISGSSIGESDQVVSDKALLGSFTTLPLLFTDPCVETFPGPVPRSASNPSSLNDLQWDCERFRLIRESLGKPGGPDGPPLVQQSWIRTYGALIAKYGRPTVASLLALAAADAGLSGDARNPEPAPEDDPGYLQAVGRMEGRDWVTSYGHLAVDKQYAARVLVRQCQYRGYSQCDTLPIFAPGNDVYEAAQHDVSAIASGKPSRLKARSSADTLAATGVPRRWYRSDSRCVGRTGGGTGKECDEYPFYASKWGADKPREASLDAVDASQNGDEGTRLQGFYNVCHVYGREYLVVPTVGSDRSTSPIPTTSWCGD